MTTRVIRVVVSLVVCASAIGCGGGASPTSPSSVAPLVQQPAPIRPASVVTEGSWQWLGDCPTPWHGYGGICDIQWSGRNVGQGCAGRVRGTTWLYDNGNRQVAAFDWNLSSGRVVRANESFVFKNGFIVPGAVTAAHTARTEFFWNNVAC